MLIALEIGRFVLFDDAEQITDSETVSEGQELEQGGNLGEIYDIQFLGVTKTSDNPWGITAGKINIENEGQCIFLMPGTSVSFRMNKVDKTQLVLSTMLHPWVRDKSDGVDITVEIYAVDHKTLLGTEQFRISNAEKTTEKEISISKIKADEIEVVLSCNVEDNQDADWAVIKKVSV